MINRSSATVARFELYLSVSIVFLFMLLVQLSAGQAASESVLAFIGQTFLTVALLFMQLLYLGYAVYYRSREQAERAPQAVESDKPL